MATMRFPSSNVGIQSTEVFEEVLRRFFACCFSVHCSGVAMARLTMDALADPSDRDKVSRVLANPIVDYDECGMIFWLQGQSAFVRIRPQSVTAIALHKHRRNEGVGRCSIQITRRESREVRFLTASNCADAARYDSM